MALSLTLYIIETFSLVQMGTQGHCRRVHQKRSAVGSWVVEDYGLREQTLKFVESYLLFFG